MKWENYSAILSIRSWKACVWLSCTKLNKSGSFLFRLKSEANTLTKPRSAGIRKTLWSRNVKMDAI